MRYRCSNCGKEFVSESPKCVCGVDPATDPRHAALLTELATIHYDPPSGIGSLGVGTLACNPARKVAGSRATGVPAVVNCERCRATDAWKTAHRAEGDPEFVPSEDEKVSVTPKGVVTTESCC